MTGETQLRARRTRIKILKAIADKNGTAGFSEIRDATGLSTGSIYYHLERMENYVTKDSKHYNITPEGIQMLQEIENKNAAKRNQEKSQASTPHQLSSEETIKQNAGQKRSMRATEFAPLMAGVLVIIGILSFYNSQTLMSSIASTVRIISSAGILSTISIAMLLSISFIVMLRRQISIRGYKGIMMLSITILASLLVANILVFSGTNIQIGANSLSQYNNSMDALLSSYSFNWGF